MLMGVWLCVVQSCIMCLLVLHPGQAWPWHHPVSSGRSESTEWCSPKPGQVNSILIGKGRLISVDVQRPSTQMTVVQECLDGTGSDLRKGMHLKVDFGRV